MKCICTKKETQDIGLLILRLALGSVFIYHGYGKLSNIEATTGFFTMLNLPLPMVFAYLVGLVEFLGGLAVVLGVYVRAVGMALGATMLMALFLVHLGKPWSTAELAILALGGSAALVAVGAGKYRLAKSQCVCGAETCETCAIPGGHTH